MGMDPAVWIVAEFKFFFPPIWAKNTRGRVVDFIDRGVNRPHSCWMFGVNHSAESLVCMLAAVPVSTDRNGLATASLEVSERSFVGMDRRFAASPSEQKK